MSLESTAALFDQLLATDKRRAAEVAYVLAQLHLNLGDNDKARNYARQSISLFESCEMKSLEQCAGLYISLDGVGVPSWIHQDVVRQRFKHLGL